MIAVCNDDSALVGVSPRPEAVGKPKEVDLVDGAQHLGDRALDDLVFQRRHAERAPPTIGLRDVDAPDRVGPVASGMDPGAEVLEIAPKVALVVVHRDPVDSRTRPPLLTPERSFERFDVNVMQQGRAVNRVWTAPEGRRVHPGRALDGRATRLCVRTLPCSPGFLPGWPLPSARLVSFDGVIGTTNQSVARPQLGRRLWQCLAALPRQRPI